MQKIFPYKLHLFIFQLENYQVIRLLSWVKNNFCKRKLENKKNLKWTTKAKLIYYLALFLAVLTIFILSLKLNFIGLIFSLILITQSYLFLILSSFIIKPLEKILIYRIKNKTKKKILHLKKNGLKIIGITGSFGKTSTKEFSYQILKEKYRVLRTPESYNTLLGIAKVIDLELDQNYDFFICEMGAYQIGEIKEICDMVLPDYGILTSIGEMHLERFGSLENIIKAKFELAEAVKIVILNQGNQLIMDNYQQFKINQPIFYNLKNNELKTNLIDKNNLSNILAAVTLAEKLGVEKEKIIKVIKNLKPVPHRLEIKKYAETITLIDDAYNSNYEGFSEALKVLNSCSEKNKILVTPGIIELGIKTNQVHENLGQLADGICDKIYLIGASNRVKALASGVKNKNKIIYLNSIKDFFNILPGMANSAVLIENDLPDNY